MRTWLSFLFMALCVTAQGATITAAAGGGNWATAITWVGAATPTAADDVVLANTSGSVTVNTGTCVAKSVTATGFTNNLAFTAGQKLTMSGNFILGSGMTLSGTGNITFIVAASLTSAGLTFPGSLTYSGTNIYTMNDAWTVNGGVSQVTNTSTINGNSVTCKGNFGITGATAGTTLFVLAGSGTWSTGGAGNTVNILISSSGNVTLGNSITLGSCAVTYLTGTINNSSSVLTSGATSGAGVTYNTAGMSWGRVNFNAPQTMVLQGNWSSIGTVQVTAGVTVQGAFNMACSQLSVNAPVTMAIPAGQALTVTTKINFSGNDLQTAMLKSATASSAMSLVYNGSYSEERNLEATFIDVDASLSAVPILNYFGGNPNGTLTRTVNIVNTNLPVPRGFIY